MHIYGKTYRLWDKKRISPGNSKRSGYTLSLYGLNPGIPSERLIVYGIKKGYVDIVRGPVKEMMREIGVPYAHSFLEHIFSMAARYLSLSCSSHVQIKFR